MNIPGIGPVTKDDDLDWYYSEQIAVPVLGRCACRFVVAAYGGDLKKEDFHIAIRNFLAADESVLREAEPYIYQYYESCKQYFDSEDNGCADIKTTHDVWKHVRLGNEPVVKRRAYGDKCIYISLECKCDWENQHGLQLVFKNGLKVNKVGAYNGHVTNSDAYDDDSLEDLIFNRPNT
ncbi:MAG: hypothetical protein R3C17_08800 [Planctomycetaceae bacterium]